MKTLTKALIPVLMLAALCVVAPGQTGLTVPGDITVGDDATVGDDLQVGDDSNVDGTSTMNKHSSSYLPQRTLVQFSEAASTGKAFPDTIVGMAKRLYFYAPCDGLLYDLYFGMEDNGSGWDSLLVDAFAGVGCDTSMLTTLPMLIPGDGDKSNTSVDGRAAVMSGTMRNVDAGERVELWAKLYGSAADPPDGLTVWGWFQPDYGN